MHSYNVSGGAGIAAATTVVADDDVVDVLLKICKLKPLFTYSSKK